MLPDTHSCESSLVWQTSDCQGAVAHNILSGKEPDYEFI